MPYTYPYPRPAVTCDVALFTMLARDLAVLLVRRKGEPFAGAYALPGGFVDEDEALEDAARRELEEETGLRGVALEQLGAFGAPGRDPRGHTVSIAFVGFVLAPHHPVRAGDDAAEVAWVPLKSLALGSNPRRGAEPLAFDHGVVLSIARRRLEAHLDHPGRSAPFDFVPSRFTLAELRLVYEAVAGKRIDDATFRRRVQQKGGVEPVRAEGSGRGRLYRWKAAARGRPRKGRSAG